MTLYRPIMATSKPLSPNKSCPRCGGPMSDRHPSVQCGDCNDVLRMEKSFIRRGIDITLVPDEVLEELSTMSWDRRKRALTALAAEHKARRAHPSSHGRAAA